jgi:hypothetical protein
MKRWLEKVVLDAVQKYFPVEFKKRADDDNSIKDLFGYNVSAIDLISYPPTTFGTKIIEPSEILARHSTLVRQMKRNSMITERLHDKTKPTFETLYQDVMINYIKYIHNLPASESHHHSGPGGLTRHSLEVAEKSLRHADSVYLEPKYTLDIERERKPRWLYASWLCGLLHDAGKLYTDIKVISVDNIHEWDPHKESLTGWATRLDVKRYKVEYLGGRVHGLHGNVGADILKDILSDTAREYLTNCPDDLMTEIKRTLNGFQTTKGYLSNAVRAGDTASVSADMVIAWNEELGPKKSALYQVIMKGMRVLGKQWSYNRQGARIQIINGDVYLGWPYAIQETIDYLLAQKINVPKSAETVLGLLRERGLIDNGESAEKYVLIFNGDYDKERIVNVASGNAPDKWEMYVRTTWPSIVFDKDPIPDNTHCLIKLNRDFDCISYRANGEIEQYVRADIINEGVSEKKNPSPKLTGKSAGTVPPKKGAETEAQKKPKVSAKKNNKEGLLSFNAGDLSKMKANNTETPDRVEVNTTNVNNGSTDTLALTNNEDVAIEKTDALTPDENNNSDEKTKASGMLLSRRKKPKIYPWKKSLKQPCEMDIAIQLLCDNLKNKTISIQEKSKLMLLEDGLISILLEDTPSMFNLSKGEITAQLKREDYAIRDLNNTSSIAIRVKIKKTPKVVIKFNSDISSAIISAGEMLFNQAAQEISTKLNKTKDDAFVDMPNGYVTELIKRKDALISENIITEVDGYLYMEGDLTTASKIILILLGRDYPSRPRHDRILMKSLISATKLSGLPQGDKPQYIIEIGKHNGKT